MTTPASMAPAAPPPPSRPPQPKQKPRKGPGLTPILLRAIEDHTLELFVRGEVSARTIARRLAIPQQTVETAMAGLLAQHRSEAATLRSGIAAALAEGAAARRDAWT